MPEDTKTAITLASCLFFGFAFDLFKYNDQVLYKNAFGIREWKYTKTNLEIFSTILFVLMCIFVCNFHLLSTNTYLVCFIIGIATSVFWLFIELCIYISYHIGIKSKKKFLTVSITD